jgi:hypothetical protein
MIGVEVHQYLKIAIKTTKEGNQGEISTEEEIEEVVEAEEEEEVSGVSVVVKRVTNPAIVRKIDKKFL